MGDGTKTLTEQMADFRHHCEDTLAEMNRMVSEDLPAMEAKLEEFSGSPATLAALAEKMETINSNDDYIVRARKDRLEPVLRQAEVVPQPEA